MGTSEDLRDRLTRQHLAAAAEAPEPSDVRGFRRNWWDGAARVPALLVRLPGAGRCRLVQAGGTVVAVPATGWRARRAVRRLRRAATVDPQLLDLASKHPDPRLDGRPRVSIVEQRSDHPRGRPARPLRLMDRPRLVVHIEQEADVVRCGNLNCAALVPIPPPGRMLVQPGCPACGRVELPAQQESPGTARRVVLL